MGFFKCFHKFSKFLLIFFLVIVLYFFYIYLFLFEYSLRNEHYFYLVFFSNNFIKININLFICINFYKVVSKLEIKLIF